MRFDQVLDDLKGTGFIFYIDTWNGQGMWGRAVNKNDWEMHAIPFRQSLFAKRIGKNHHPICIMRPDGWNRFIPRRSA